MNSTIRMEPMLAGAAQYYGYNTKGHEGNDKGYIVTYPDGHKSWYPEEVIKTLE